MRHSRNPLSPANDGYSFAGQLFKSPIKRDAIYRSPAAPACIYIPGAEGTMELPFVLPRFSVVRVGGCHEGWVSPEDISGFADPATVSGTSTWGVFTTARKPWYTLGLKDIGLPLQTMSARRGFLAPAAPLPHYIQNHVHRNGSFAA